MLRLQVVVPLVAAALVAPTMATAQDEVAAPADEALPVPAEPKAAPAEPKAAPAEPKAAEPASLPERGLAEAFPLDGAAMMVGEDVPKLELYGFADFSYFHVLGEKDNNLRQYVAAYPSFYVGHLNLYLSSSLGENWRSLAEVRFTYAPLGDENQAPDGTFTTLDTTAVDYAELQRTFSWGGIEIQRVWIEYQPFDFLSIRGGQWLTPHGFWNTDHGSPTIIAVHKPFPISDGLFPEKQTGIEAYGKYFIDSTAIGYHLTLSNGRGPYDAIRDLDNNKAVGGRLYVDTPALGNLTVGVNAYRGRYTASTKRYRVDTSSGKPVVEIYRTVDSAYDELSLGADLRFLWRGLHVQGEFLLNEGVYDDAHRPTTVSFDPRPAFAADYRRLGAYLLVGYRTPWLNLMPYAIVEHETYTHTDITPPVTAWTGGLNLRATPNVVLKAEFSYAGFHGTGDTVLGAEELSYIGAQAAWAF